MAVTCWGYLEAITRWPHRGSTTPFEREAASWLMQTLRGMGYAAEEQPVRAPAATLYAGPPLVALVVAISAASTLLDVAAWARVVALVAAVVAVWILLVEANLSAPALDALLPLRASQNVIATRPADPRRAPASGRTPVVVVVAHYDTQRGTWLFAPAFRPFLPAFFKAAYASLALALLASALGTVALWVWPGWGAWRPAVIAGLAIMTPLFAFLALSGLTGRHVNGANDNGSGVAVALALAERWAKEPPGGVDLRFVFTGAEEVGTRGMWAYLARERSAGRLGRRAGASPMYVVNIDNVGGGRLRALLREGMLLPVPCGARLRDVAQRMARKGAPVSVWPKMLLLSTDAGPAAHMGIEALTFIGLDDGGRIPHYHWHSDMMLHVDPHHLEEVCGTIHRYVTSLAQELAPHARATTRR